MTKKNWNNFYLNINRQFNADLNFWDYHYLRRLRLNLFYDRTDYEVVGFKDDLQSFGAEFGFDATWFRRFPLAYGVRYSYKVDSDQVWDFFLGTNLTF